MTDGDSDLARNKALVNRFFETANRGSLDDALALLSDDCTWWTVMDSKTKGEFVAAMNGLGQVLTGPIIFEVDTMTAEDDRVAVEARSRVDLKNGKVYANTYHFLFRVRSGQVVEVREHCDTQHAVETFGSLG